MGELVGNGKSGAKADCDASPGDVDCVKAATGGDKLADADADKSSWLALREGTREGTLDEVCECRGDRTVSEAAEPEPEPDAGDGARVAVGVLGTFMSAGLEKELPVEVSDSPR